MNKMLHVCSLNCQGLVKKEERQRFYEWCKQQTCSKLYAQETHVVNVMPIL